jgi:4-diphosphocytidyl-2-C-methyl-D-erythritol kinase
MGITAPAKVNLALFLGPRRDDDRHELATLFESVSLADELLVTEAEQDEVVCEGVAGPNLVEAALAQLRARGWDGPALRVEIAKRIPVAAGMGGGSADAAAILRAAREFGDVPQEAIAEIAAELGADVPSQLEPGLTLGTGAGDVVQRLPPLASHAFVILPSRHALSTAEVYREADRLGLGRSPEELAAMRDAVSAAATPGARLPASLLTNDLEPAALSLCPAAADAMRDARRCDPDAVLVCGSGPTVAAVIWGESAAEIASEAVSSLQSDYPGAVVAQPVGADFGIPRIA